MKEFTSCFVGVPLPYEFQKEFEELLLRVNKISPDLQLTQKETPHLTVYYLDKQSQHNISKIESLVKGQMDLIKGCDLQVGGLDIFGEEYPRVLFLPIKFPPVLASFNSKLKGELSEFRVGMDELPFHPHMTVAWFAKGATFESWEKVKAEIESEMNKVNWQFPITEVVIYGVDSIKTPQYQEKLVRIPV